MPVGERTLTAEEVAVLSKLPTPQFCVTSTTSLTLSEDLDDPTVFGTDADMIALTLCPSSSDDFEIVVNSRNEQWLKNNTGRDLATTGVIMYQNAATGGGNADLVVWSDISSDDGETFDVNDDSLRTKEVGNNDESTETFPSFTSSWPNGSCIRFCSVNDGGGSITLDPLTRTVHTDKVVTGYSVYWTLEDRT